MKRSLAAALLTATLAACGITSVPTRRYAGRVTPTALGKTCVETRGVASIKGDHVLFAPDNATWILDGAANPNGTLVAERTASGAGHQPFETRLEATWTTTAITGTYTTPRCTFKVELGAS